MSEKRNILLVIADDLGRSLGCYGDKTIQTPNIDKLASQGVVFDNAFASTASCSGSRSVIYTGLHTHENGQYGLNHYAHHFMTFDNVETAPKLFRDHGYFTGIIGKIHVGPPNVYPWEVVDESPTRNVNWVAERAKSFFESASKDERPFFLTVGYMDPHRDDTRGGFGNFDQVVSREDPLYDVARVDVPGYLSDIPEVRRELAEYYRSIARVDRGLGLIIKYLKQYEHDKNTLIIFTSDNGPPFLNSKTTLYDAGIRLPFIVSQPQVETADLNPNFVSFVDILPTLLDWAEYQPTKTTTSQAPPRCGRSFLPILSKTTLDTDWSKVYGSHTFHEITNYYPTRFIRTRKYKYHRNIAWKLDFPFATDLYASLSWEGMRNVDGPVMIGWRTLEAYIRRPAEQLFDMEQDAKEVKNLADDPNYADILLQMRNDMENWQKETNDPWLVRDGVSLLEMRGHLRAGLKIPDRFDFEVKAPGSK